MEAEQEAHLDLKVQHRLAVRAPVRLQPRLQLLELAALLRIKVAGVTGRSLRAAGVAGGVAGTKPGGGSGAGGGCGSLAGP